MREMKDSGVAWIGEIPNHWEVQKGRHLFLKEDRPVKPTDGIVTCFRDGQVTLRSNRRTDGFTIALKEIGYQGIRKGDLVIHNMDAFAGAIGVSDSDGKSTPVYSVCTPKDNQKTDTYYYCYLLRMFAVNGIIQSLSKGIRERSTDFRFKDFGELIYHAPPISEQQAIAIYLDNKCTEIDELITLQETMISELQAYKQSVITEAVTKGLDKNVKLKDSGVEWIGEIPEHWNICKIQNLASLKSGQNLTTEQIKDEGLYPVYGGNGLRGYYDKYLVDGTYVLIGRQGALCGNINYGHGKFWPTEHAVVCYKLYKYSEKWFGEALRTMNLGQYSLASAQPGLSVERIKQLSLPLPSFDEQQTIATYLDQKTKEIDSLITIKQQKIAELKEYKKSTIFEYVTGKKEVPAEYYKN